MNAGQAGSFVAKFIELSWPNDRKKIFEILKLAINKAWHEGKWFGMTAEFFVQIMEDQHRQPYIVGPASHPILLACNRQGVNRIDLRDQYFMFHKNGKGDIRHSAGCRWNTDVYDIGYSPILNKHNVNLKQGVLIGVRALGVPGPNEKVYINGTYPDGEKIYTYQNTEFGKPCGCPIDKTKIETINGISLDISTNFNYISNIKFSSISSITKTLTRTPIEIIVVDPLNNAYPIARLEPNQTASRYRQYLSPAPCGENNCIHGLFKCAQQDDIINDTDELIIKNPEALIALCKGIHNLYYTNQPDLGASYILQGVSILEKERREEEIPSEFSIQVDWASMDQVPEGLKRY